VQKTNKKKKPKKSWRIKTNLEKNKKESPDLGQEINQKWKEADLNQILIPHLRIKARPKRTKRIKKTKRKRRRKIKRNLRRKIAPNKRRKIRKSRKKKKSRNKKRNKNTKRNNKRWNLKKNNQSVPISKSRSSKASNLITYRSMNFSSLSWLRKKIVKL